MRDFIKLIIAGVVLFFSPYVCAENYKVLVIPDNIVSENAAIDSYIYDASAELFADGVISILNGTVSINAQPVSDVRKLLKQEPTSMLAARKMTDRFKNTYNIDYAEVKKIAAKANVRYVALITSSVDAENYILRRTFWDFLNIAGATVVDPAYKISTYAVLIDTKYNTKEWDDTYYKTISVCENRIITRGPSPQTEQLEKIRDYSKYLCPQIARNIQLQLLPAGSSEIVSYGVGDIDNVFTKKYRHLGKETKKLFKKKKTHMKAKAAKSAETESPIETELKVKATPVHTEEPGANKINCYKKQSEPKPVVDYVDDINKKPTYSENINLDSVNLNVKKRKHNLYGDYQTNQPRLRDYSK